MKKLQSFSSFIIIITFLFAPIAPALALGEVDVGTTNSAPTVVEATPPAPEPTPTVTTETTTSTDTTSTTVGDTTVSANTSTGSETTVPTITVFDTTPPVITDIVSASLLPTEATVAWVTNELAVSHFRYGTTTSYGSTVTLGTGGALVHVATMLNLSPATTYYYCIDATDLFNNTSDSCGHSFTTAIEVVQADTNPPTILTVSVSPVTTTSAGISWTTDQVANGYVEYGTTMNYGTTVNASSDYAPAHSVTLSSLLPNTTYHYRITSHDGIGNTAYTPDETFTTAALVGTGETIVTAPTGTLIAPTLLVSSVEASTIGETSATITWTTDLLSDSQAEYGNNINLGLHTTLNSNLTTNHSVTISNLSPDTSYYFRVKSKPTPASVATVSNLHEFSTLIVPIFVTTPATILSVSSSNVSTTSANVSWTTDIAATGHVEYGISTQYGQTTTMQTSQSSQSVGLDDLVPSTTYHYRIKAVTVAGDITYSDDHTFTTTHATTTVSAPSAISNLSVSGHDATSAQLSWNTSSADSDAGMFTEVRYSTSLITESNWNAAISAQLTPIIYPELSPSGTARTYLVAGLSPNTMYYFALKQKYETGDWSVLSNVVSATTLASVPVGSPNDSLNEIINDNSGNGLVVESGNSTTGGDSGTAEPFIPETTTSLPIAHPTFVNATGLDEQIVFTWNNPNEADFVRTIIVKKAGNYPTTPADGTVVFESDSETFTDTDVNNGTTYYYAFYSYDHARTYSESVRVSLAPIAVLSSSRGGSSGKSSGGGSVGQVVLRETPVIMPLGVEEHFTTVWEKGDTHIEIEHVQHVLALDGEFYPTTIIDGKFGAVTEKGLKQFQSKYKLPITGVTDVATQKQLNLVSQSLVTLDIPGDARVLEKDLKPGDAGEAVKSLQQLLADEGSHQDIIDGKYGRQTQVSVRAFQLKYFVKPPSGIVGSKTRHMLKVVTGL